ncbi:MAG: hypothetical protein GY715_14270 [Planctomycetes bacterium]|nr:hypothetical protein [Planctomycetota bacterium]
MALGRRNRNIALRFRGDSRELEGTLTRIGKQLGVLDKRTGRASRGLQRLGKSLGLAGGIGSAVAAFVSVRKLADVTKQAVAAAERQESVEVALAQALRNRGQAVESALPSISRMASALQDLTGIGDEEILEGQQQIVALGGIVGDELERATKAALDLGAQIRNNATAFDLVSKASAGYTSTLSRYGIILDKGIPQGEKFAAALDAIEQRFGGQAARQLDTYAGRTRELGNRWGDFIEKLGLTITTSPAVRTALEGLSDIIKELTDRIDTSTGQDQLKKFVLLLADMGILVSQITPIIANFITFYTGLIGVLSDGVPDNVIDGMLETFERMQTVSNATAELEAQLRALRKSIAEASTEPLNKPLADTGDESGGAAEEISKFDAALKSLGITLDSDLEKKASSISQAVGLLNQQLASGAISPERYDAVLGRLRQMAATIREQGGIVPGLQEASDGLTEFQDNVARLTDGFRFSGEEFIASIANQAQTLTDLATDLYGQLTQGVGDALGDVLIRGEDGGERLKALFESIGQTVISFLVDQGIQAVAASVASGVASAKEHASRLGQLAAQTYGAAFAATAAIPIVGPALAPGVAAGAQAAMLAGSTGAFAAGIAVGASQGSAGGFQQGGQVTGPRRGRDTQFAAVDGGETILDTTPAEGRALLSGRARIVPADGGGSGGGITVIVENRISAMDGRDVMRVLRRNPRAVARAYERAILNRKG